MLLLKIVSAYTAYSQNTWTQQVDFGGVARWSAIGFSVNGKGYLGTGTYGENDFWEFDPTSEVWTQKANLPGETITDAVGFSIGNYGYLGTGWGVGIQATNHFWQYDPAQNKWTKKKKFPGDKRSLATGFSIGNKGYIGSGAGQQSDYKEDFYEYDPVTDTWTQIADLPGASRVAATGFSIGNKGYSAFGSKGSSGASTDLWEYDSFTGEWTHKSSFPGTARFGAVGFVIGSRAFLGLGTDNGNINHFMDFRQYDSTNDTWSQVDSFPGSPREYAVGFAIGDNGYVGTGRLDPFTFFKDFWEFTPGCAVPVNLSAINISSQSAKLKWDAVGSATKYKVQYREVAPGAPWITKLINASKNYLTINGLAANTTYKWKVRSMCGEEHSEYSATQTFTTLLRLNQEEGDQSTISVFPNPFSSSGVLSFYLEENTSAIIEVFDLAGRKTTLLKNEALDAGQHEVLLSREQIGVGVFLVKLVTGNRASVIKVMVQ